MKIDKVDVQILEILQKEGRITTKALAEKLSLTTTPVFERVKRLEKEGIINKYVALLDQKKIDKKLIVFVSLSLKNHTRSYLEGFVKEMNSFIEVQECYHIAGNFDYMIKVIVRDMEEYERFLLTKVSTNNNIATVQSSFVLSKSKYSTAMPINL